MNILNKLVFILNRYVHSLRQRVEAQANEIASLKQEVKRIEREKKDVQRTAQEYTNMAEDMANNILRVFNDSALVPPRFTKEWVSEVSRPMYIAVRPKSITRLSLSGIPTIDFPMVHELLFYLEALDSENLSYYGERNQISPVSRAMQLRVKLVSADGRNHTMHYAITEEALRLLPETLYPELIKTVSKQFMESIKTRFKGGKANGKG